MIINKFWKIPLILVDLVSSIVMFEIYLMLYVWIHFDMSGAILKCNHHEHIGVTLVYFYCIVSQKDTNRQKSLKLYIELYISVQEPEICGLWY